MPCCAGPKWFVTNDLPYQSTVCNPAKKDGTLGLGAAALNIAICSRPAGPQCNLGGLLFAVSLEQ